MTGLDFGLGCPKTNNTARCVTKLARFHGCMQQIFIDDEPVDIDVMLQRKWGRYTELLLGTCSITDRFVCVQTKNNVLSEQCTFSYAFLKAAGRGAGSLQRAIITKVIASIT